MSEQERERLKAEYNRIGPCYQISTGVYCGKMRMPDSAAGLCGRCDQRQAIRDKLRDLGD